MTNITSESCVVTKLDMELMKGRDDFLRHIKRKGAPVIDTIQPKLDPRYLYERAEDLKAFITQVENTLKMKMLF